MDTANKKETQKPTDSDKPTTFIRNLQAGELDKPGTGIAFVVPVEKLVGVAHRCDERCAQ